MTTTDEVMELVRVYADCCELGRLAQGVDAYTALRSAVSALVAERDALKAALDAPDAAPSVAPEPVAGSAAYVIQLLLAAGYVAADKVAQAEAIARSVDCEAAHPPRAPLTEADFSRIARMAALLTREKYDYLPKTLDECRSFNPHQWVIEAMKNAVKEAAHGISAEGEKT